VTDDHHRRFVTNVLIAAAALAFLSLILLGVSVAVRRRNLRRQQRRQALLAPAPAATTNLGNDDPEGGGGGGAGVVHHVWYIRTVGLDEAAIESIAATRYRAGAGLLGAADCSVCLGEFSDGELLRLLPKCGHAFHVPCIDTWLRAHVNCPLCRAPVKVASGNAAEPAANLVMAAGAGAQEAGREGDLSTTERALRRAASMVALPRRAFPDVDSLRAPASNSAREGEMGLAKTSRVLKLSEALEMAAIGARRSASFSAASSLRLPGRSGQPAAGANADEITR
jgi:hypothetical protein